MPKLRSTTVVAVRRDGRAAMAADGQVSLGSTVMKERARKVRTLASGRVLTGFAGASADAFTLLDRFEQKLEGHQHNLSRAAVELAKDWRTDRYLRRLEAMLLVADAKDTYVLSGTGDIIEPDDGVASIGSGGPYALAAARALVANTALPARAVAEAAMGIAADICLYTNRTLTLEELG